MTQSESSTTLDEALSRLHTTGPEHEGYLSNHGPMAVEALVRHGRTAAEVHHWIDGYRSKLEEMPAAGNLRLDEENWREYLGRPRHLADWTGHFGRLMDQRPWREVLAQWWPRLLPGILGGATHPAIRVGHAVRTLLADGDSAPRTAELAQALGYWAARSLPPATPVTLSGAHRPARALAEVPRVPSRRGGLLSRVGRLPDTPGWPAAVRAPRPARGPEDARELLSELVCEAVRRYAEGAHGEPVMLVHSATAPNAVLRTLPALPRELWVPSYTAAWLAAATVTAAYAPTDARPVPAAVPGTAEEAFERAAAHGDEHVIKLADTALDVAAAAPHYAATALAAVDRACELVAKPAWTARS
ncbi:questin oxidase family protein [Streptomyces orinoci]|uniref:Questin oxidase family protein n=1 Tax=Streptomyces orinoci TaxID=67339 RepID=A0ABV3JYF0_STRON|nr:questin oxidase family protein [Streptomyces orinoci]